MLNSRFFHIQSCPRKPETAFIYILTLVTQQKTQKLVSYYQTPTSKQYLWSRLSKSCGYQVMQKLTKQTHRTVCSFADISIN